MPLKRVFTHKSPKEHYIAAATTVGCIDARFYKTIDRFLASLFEDQYVDRLTLVGGAKALAESNDPNHRSAMEQIKDSLVLHKSPQLLLMLHENCGGYASHPGLLASVNEIDFLCLEHEKIYTNVRKYINEKGFSSVPIRVYIVDFDGVQENELASAQDVVVA